MFSNVEHPSTQFVKGFHHQRFYSFVDICPEIQIILCAAGLSQQILPWLRMFPIPPGFCLFRDVRLLPGSRLSFFITPFPTVVLIDRVYFYTPGTPSSFEDNGSCIVENRRDIQRRLDDESKWKRLAAFQLHWSTTVTAYFSIFYVGLATYEDNEEYCKALVEPEVQRTRNIMH